MLTTILLAFSFGFILFVFFTKRRQNLPPGPPRYKFFSSFSNLKPQNSIFNFRQLRKQYGDIFCAIKWPNTVIVVNGREELREIFVKRADYTSDRPLSLITIITNGLGIAGSSGHIWKEQRSFALATLRNFGVGKRYIETPISEEVEMFLSCIRQTKGEAFDIHDFLTISISNIICCILFGKRYEHTDKDFLKLLNLVRANLGNSRTGILNFIPALRFVPGDTFGFKSTMENIDQLSKFLIIIIKNHKETLDKNNIRDFIDAYLLEQKQQKCDSESAFSDAQLKVVIQNLFVAGTDTTATTLRWLVLYLIHYQDVQAKMRKEIDDVIGFSRQPSLEHRPNLPYCEAVITEAQRIANIAPVSLPHTVNKTFEYKGYIFPKGATIFPNLDSVLSDPHVFPDPEKFDPTRFLSETGEFVRNENVIPFSLGRRVCLGESLAKMELFFFTVSLVQNFELLPDDPDSLPTLKSNLGIIRSPHSYKLRAKERI